MDSTKNVAAFEAMLLSFIPSFTKPTHETFVTVTVGWVLCLGRPTIVRIIASASEVAKKHLSSHHRFFGTARRKMEDLRRILVTRILVPLLVPCGKIVVAGDDTTCGKTGRHVACAGYYRDAVRSTVKQKVIHWAHSWVILTLQVRLGLWPLRVISFPVMARLYRKPDQCDRKHPFGTRGQLVLDMMRTLADWLVGREFELLVDGAYPSEELASGLPENVKTVSRIRRDAAIYALPPVVKERGPGRPPEKGARLPTPAEIARKVTRERPIRIVIVRDPSGRRKDDCFFAEDLSMGPARVVELYAARWGIEEAIREAKQVVGFDDVQGWKERTVERQAPLALMLLSLVKAWYVQHVAPVERPAALPSAAGLVTRLRIAYWQRRITALSAPRREVHKLGHPEFLCFGAIGAWRRSVRPRRLLVNALGRTRRGGGRTSGPSWLTVPGPFRGRTTSLEEGMLRSPQRGPYGRPATGRYGGSPHRTAGGLSAAT